MLALWFEPHEYMEPVRPPGGPSAVPGSQSSSMALPNSSLAPGWTDLSVSSQSVVAVQPSASWSFARTTGCQLRRVADVPSETVTSTVCRPTKVEDAVNGIDSSIVTSWPSSVHDWPSDWPSGSEALAVNVTAWPSVSVTERAAGLGASTGGRSPLVTLTTA